MKKFAIILVFLIFAGNAAGSVMFDPDLEWKSVRTTHFWIHYHTGLEDAARRLCMISEKVHARLSRDLGWEPYFRTDVVLVDNMDLCNGFAQPMPHNRIQIYISRPELDDVLSNFNDWLELVFLHEYVHILNIDTIRGLPALSRYTLGRCCFPNMFLPIWQVEGNAVYHESRDTVYGRNNSTYTDMVLRSEVASNTLKSLDEASHYPRRWPSGAVPYLYGGLFVEYLEKRFGRDTFARVMTENADNVIPYLVNYNVRLIYRENVSNLWKDWRRELVKRYRSQITTVEKEGLTRYKKITSTGYRTSLPRFHPGGKSVYWVRATGYDSPALMVKSLVSQKETELCDVHYPGSLSVTLDGIAYLADLELWRTFSLYSDIFRFDGSYEQITDRLRALYLDVTPDGRTAVFVRQENDRYSLMKRDLTTGTMTHIIHGTDVQLASPRISPDGKSVVFTMRDRNASTDLVLHDLSGGGFTRLTNDSFSDIHPSWHPNGEKIVFSSDRSGIYNLYELSLKEMRIGRITNLLGGAFNPDVSPGGSSIVFSNYDQEGYNIALMEYPSAYSGRFLLSAARLSSEYFSIPGGDVSLPAPASSYSIWNSVLPTWWYPIYFTEEVYEDKYDNAMGISISGNDTLYRYIYSLSAYIFSFQKRAVIDAQLMISTLYPNILLAYYDESLFYGADKFPWSDANPHPTRRSMEKNLAAGLVFPYMRYLSQHMALLAFKHERSTTDMFSPGSVTQRYVDTLAYSHLAYSYNNARNYSYSISEEDGRSFYVIYDHYMHGTGSDYQFYKVRGEYSEFLPGFWRNNVFMFRVRGGASVGAPDHLVPYNLGRYEKGERGSPPVDEDAFGMRGYPSGFLYGERLAIGAAEYRMPVVQPDLGFSTTPVMLRDIWVVFFAEYGNVWNGGARARDFRSSSGIELHAKFTFGYFIDLSGYVGYARGFADPGETQVYFGVSTLYEGTASHRNKWFDFF